MERTLMLDFSASSRWVSPFDSRPSRSQVAVMCFWFEFMAKLSLPAKVERIFGASLRRHLRDKVP
jgi:hypothetical protein